MENRTAENATNSSEETVTPICHNDYCLTDQEYIAMVEEHIQPTSGEWVLVAVFVVLFIVGLIGNFLVCYAVIKNSQMRTVTNLFIMNLAIADLMVILICLPPTLLVDVSETWFFGEVMCKIFLYFQTVSVAVSVLTLSAISIERWYAICRPLSFKSTPSRARNIIFTIWVFSAFVAVPDMITAQLYHTLPAYYNDVRLLLSCRPSWSERSQFIYQMFLLIGLYFLPFCLMAFTYTMIALVLWRKDIPGANETSRGHRTMQDNRTPNTEVQLQTRRKAAKMLITVVIVFGICNLPVHILNIIRYSRVLDSMNAIPIFSLISRLLCYFNSAVNPIIYNFMSAKFRKEFKAVCMCCVPRLKRAPKHRHPKWKESYNFSYSRTNCQTEQFTLTSVKD